ncbi:MAG: putative glycerol-3-phosphate acyltransferase [Steroidobacteraceae bacterium]|nr:putative glycerol-3-phosphate acyltransferase [Steroidobacteraceae bacterium]
MSAGIAMPVLVVLAAYLLGSVSGALVIGALRGGIDIRTQGSGNAGGTNALRTQGIAFAVGVVIIDLGKGWLAAAWLPVVAQRFGATTAWLPAACAFAAMLGHVWPVWHGFRGGKGAATLVGALLALSPGLLGVVLGVWLLMVVLFGFVGLASVAAAIALPVAVAFGRVAPFGPLLGFGIAAAMLVAFTHRANLARMRAGTEPRARRLWLAGRGR